MPTKFIASLLFVSSMAFPADEPRDYSKEAGVIQSMANKVKFSDDGSREWQQIFSVKVQSEAAVRQFGVLSFSYSSENEQIKVDYVRVRKADGTVVETPESSVQDVATEVARVAPTYSDVRQKQVPVKALGVGDVLEYSVHTSLKNIETPGQFWYEQYFVKGAVVLSQTLEIEVPKGKYVQVSSKKLKYETRDEGDRRTYVWKYSQLERSKPEEKKKAGDTEEEEPLKAQITSFKNWEEVGAWWAALAAPQAEVTATIQQKANELTKGLTSEADKERALYSYVAMKFRYISISLGAGRYRPHSASEVLANQYGDCKDKYTLLAALLKGAGIESWPALIGAGMKLDETFPSPGQFNHVITVLPQGATYTWLDSTTEVAPFGLLSQLIRDQQALVIPTSGKATLRKTPLNPTFSTSESADIKVALSKEGTVTGKFDLQTTGDSALALRSAFRQTAPTQWRELAQQISFALGYGGDVSGVDVENMEDAEKPFHYSYDYTRKNYSDWEEHRITPPLPPMYFGPGDEADKPKEAFWAGALGTTKYQASIQLPKGFSISLLPDAKLLSDFADYSSHYSVKDGTLTATREMIIKQAKVSPEQWEAYLKFTKGLKTDQTTYFVLTETSPGETATVMPSDSEAQRLLRDALAALQARNFERAKDLAAQVERINPKEPSLWSMRGFIDMMTLNKEQAITDFKKEIELHPKDVHAYQPLAELQQSLGRNDQAIQTLKDAVAAKPDDVDAAALLGGALFFNKRYAEVPPVLEKAIAAAPERIDIKRTRVEALLRSGQREKGLHEAQELVKANSDPATLNDLAYDLSEAGGPNDTAHDWAQQAVAKTEKQISQAKLSSAVDKTDLANVMMLAAEWDTLGWIYFKEDRLPEAEKYVDAAWRIDQKADVADHLGAIYEKEGKHPAAIQMWRLALAVSVGDQDAQEHLRKAGAALSGPTKLAMTAPEQLNQIRTVKVPQLPKQTGSAEFFVLLSAHGVEDTHFIGGIDALKNSDHALRTANYGLTFPDDGPEKIIRRGILSCSAYTTPSCQLTLLLPADAAK